MYALVNIYILIFHIVFCVNSKRKCFSGQFSMESKIIHPAIQIYVKRCIGCKIIKEIYNRC
jgi:hypothetical protein